MRWTTPEYAAMGRGLAAAIGLMVRIPLVLAGYALVGWFVFACVRLLIGG